MMLPIVALSRNPLVDDRSPPQFFTGFIWWDEQGIGMSRFFFDYFSSTLPCLLTVF
jgi:hypothetical protein